MRRGDAQVSEKHCNFLLNLGDATSADIEGLGEEVREKVKADSGVTLEWEIQRVGWRRERGGQILPGTGRWREAPEGVRLLAQHLRTPPPSALRAATSP